MPVTTKAIRYVLGILTGKTADYIKGWNDCHRHMAEEVIRLDDQLAQGESMYNHATARIAELEALHRTYYNQPFAEACRRAASDERERIIALLASEDFPFALCLPTSEDGDWEPVMEPQIREAMDPNVQTIIVSLD